ncbi:MAG: NUDIX domain-containing protein [Thalassotalea sp.]
MNLKKRYIVGSGLTTLILVSTGYWLGKEGGVEPIFAFLSSLLAHVPMVYFLIKTSVPKETSQKVDEKLCIEAYDFFLENILQENKVNLNLNTILNELDIGKKNAILLLIYSYERLGLLTVDEDRNLCFKSERSKAFLSSMCLSFSDSSEFIGNWKAEGYTNDEAQSMCNILTKAEQYRISKQGNDATASRVIRSSLIVIKGRHENEDRYLLQHSNAWGEGYYWFVGGIQEETDQSAEHCAIRELEEELHIPKSAITSLSYLKTVKDKRISSRLGALTEYEYSIYSIVLDCRHESVVAISKDNFAIDSHVAWQKHHRKNRWYSENELLTDPNLLKDAGNIIETLKNYPLNNIPLSLINEIIATPLS